MVEITYIQVPRQALGLYKMDWGTTGNGGTFHLCSLIKYFGGINDEILQDNLVIGALQATVKNQKGTLTKR